MKWLLLVALAAISLSACSARSHVNHSVGSLQFNFDTEPHPEDYAKVAAQMVSGRKTIFPL